jgi:hypothetical protein
MEALLKRQAFLLSHAMTHRARTRISIRAGDSEKRVARHVVPMKVNRWCVGFLRGFAELDPMWGASMVHAEGLVGGLIPRRIDQFHEVVEVVWGIRLKRMFLVEKHEQTRLIHHFRDVEDSRARYHSRQDPFQKKLVHIQNSGRVFQEGDRKPSLHDSVQTRLAVQDEAAPDE